jgi:2-oxoglutarate dehydrogenase E2 component (dihydrolipoamide succinyltransferase)
MTRELKVPRLAESISEAVVVAWIRPDGSEVRVDEPVVTLETDKAAVEIPSEFAGILRHARAVGERVEVGDVLARVEESGSAGAAPSVTSEAPAVSPATGTAPTETRAARALSAPASAAPSPSVPPAAAPPVGRPLGPAVRRMVEQYGVDPATVPASGPGGRLLKEDIQRVLEGPTRSSAPDPQPPAGTAPGSAPAGAPAAPRPPARDPRPTGSAAPATTPTGFAPARAPTDWSSGETERAVPMSRIRQRIAERLVKAQQTAAILTTFNEVDMSAVMALRSRYRDDFERRHGVRLSYMSLFSRACVLALQQIPELNAVIRDTDIVYQRHVHMGIAVGTERGLVVPVVREADQRSFPDLEREIARLGAAARAGSLSLEELSGGTFTISNGGIYGSLLSTPILNFPQSGILGMHKIEKRPVVVDDQVVVRPMMYLALSYDHRIVDGEQAVAFLKSVKERLEDPERMLIEL